jgi:hypothetical protein
MAPVAAIICSAAISCGHGFVDTNRSGTPLSTVSALAAVATSATISPAGRLHEQVQRMSPGKFAYCNLCKLARSAP